MSWEPLAVGAGCEGQPGLSRRRFLRGAAATAVSAAASSAFGAPAILRAAALNEQKLRVAFVGTGGQAEQHLHLAKSQRCVAFCDVDTNRQGKARELAPQAPAYTDWRKMFDERLGEIDAVVVAIPDHSHAVVALRAMQAGKHVYCEKPLTWSVHEARRLAEVSEQKKVATQMGNQGHASEATRLVVEWVRAGAIGDVVETHTWTDRPIWPQGNLARPEAKAAPESLNWDAWIGPAPMRPYHDGLHAFAWRGWLDFGTGAVGDIACHSWDNVFWALAPDYPSAVELVRMEEPGRETFAKRTHVRWDFPAKGGRPAFSSHWYSGGWKPPLPDEYVNDPFRLQQLGRDEAGAQKRPEWPDGGTLYVGTKGKLFLAGSPRLLPEAAMNDFKRPEPSIPRSPGHTEEWVAAARGEKPWDFPGSRFGYSGPLTEIVLLGTIAERLAQPGLRIECDAPGRTVKTKEALALTTREYRKGWELG